MTGSHRRPRLRAAAVALALVPVAGLDTAGPAAASTGYGYVSAANRILRPGCHRYRYHYVVRPGSADWTLETWLYDPKGKPKAAGDFQAGGDPEDGYGRFGLCRVGSRYGRYTITARLRWYDDPVLPIFAATRHTVWLQPAHFRLHR